jgi:UDP-N-acetylmuramoyl-L-alanyl-D-glutamate--2,6-diaminopimelate ligase
VITSDNPRSEEPRAIMTQVAAGAQPPFVTEPDRARAIELAIDLAQTGDVVLIAGKGHEAYQEIDGVRQPFSDIAVGQTCLVAWRKRRGHSAGEVNSR